MADASLSTIYQFTLIQEEGRQSAPLDGDPGGATNYGITIATLSAWLGRPADPHEVYGLTLGEAEIILQAWYYRGMGGNTMPAGVDLMQTDHAFNCGVAAAKTITRTIQRGLGAEPDGIAGPITAQAAGGVVACYTNDILTDNTRSGAVLPGATVSAATATTLTVASTAVIGSGIVSGDTLQCSAPGYSGPPLTFDNTHPWANAWSSAYLLPAATAFMKQLLGY